MTHAVPASRKCHAEVRSILGASLFVIAGLFCPVLRWVGEQHEPDLLIIPMALSGAVFLIAHVFACVGLRPDSVISMKAGNRGLRMIWGTSAAAFVLLTYWDLAEWTHAYLL
jgi:hypothetical protein